MRFDDIQIPPPKEDRKFEQMLRDLFRAELPDHFVQLHGRRGQKQHGVDILAMSRKSPRPIGIQAKLKSPWLGHTLTVPELRDEVRKAQQFSPPLERLIVGTTGPCDQRLQSAAMALTIKNRTKRRFDVQLYFWEEICELLAKHPRIAATYYPTFFQNTSFSSKRKTSATDVDLVRFLDLIALVAMAPLPIAKEHLVSLFPKHFSQPKIRRLIQRGIFCEIDGALSVSTSVARSIRGHDVLRDQANKDWESVLSPLQWHVDLAIYYAVLLIRTDRLNEAISLLADIAIGLEPGDWNSHYLSLLDRLCTKRLLGKLSNANQIKVLNALGLCHARAGNTSEALARFAELHDKAKKFRDSWGVGQSLINSGVTYHDAGDSVNAKLSYERAAKLARRTGDHMLLGRSLGNLAQMLIDTDLARARSLLRESRCAKRKCKDLSGEVVSLVTEGRILGQCGKQRQARKLFKSAASLANKYDLRYDLAVVLCNLGHAHFDLREYRQAKRCLQQCLTVCADEGFAHPADLARLLTGCCDEAVGDFDGAKAVFHQLLSTSEKWVSTATRVRACVKVNEILVKQGETPRAWENVIALGRVLRGRDDRWSLIEVVQNLVASETTQGRGRAAIRALCKIASRVTSADLAYRAAIVEAGYHVWKPQSEDFVMANGILQGMLDLCRKSRNHDGEFRAMQLRASLQFDMDDRNRALTTLSKAQLLASRRKRADHEGCIAFQRANYLHILQCPEQAEGLYRHAISIAKRLGRVDLLTEACNNLGELLRRHGKPKEAIGWFVKAEHAMTEGAGSPANIAYNRALALHSLGKEREAKTLLRQIYRESVKNDNGIEAVRALMGLANLVETDSEPGASIPVYENALREAHTHGVPHFDITNNLSIALRRAGRSNDAAKLLQRLCDTSPKSDLSLDTLIDTAEAWDEAGKLSRARRCWEKVLKLAKAAMDREHVAFALASLGDLARKQRRFDEAFSRYRLARSWEPNSEDIVLLTISEFELALEAVRPRQVSKLYCQLEREVQGHPDKLAIRCDVHFLFGDNQWKKRETRPQAVEAYLVGMTACLASGDGEWVADALTHVTSTLAEGIGRDLDECERLFTHAQNWIGRRKFPRRNMWVQKAILVPITIVRNALLKGIDLMRLDGKQIQRLFQVEIRRSLASP